MHDFASRLARLGLRCLAAAAVGLGAAGAARAAEPAPAPPLRIVGGLASVNQYTRQEEPFWTRDLPRLSGGRYRAEIVPFDRAGIRGQEMLRLMQLGVVPFGTAILGLTASQEPVFGAPDLVGLNPDMSTLRRTVAAFRPFLDKTLRERYGIELLAVYVYPAQVIFCNKPLTSLSDLAGRRIRTSSDATWSSPAFARPGSTSWTRSPIPGGRNSSR